MDNHKNSSVRDIKSLLIHLVSSVSATHKETKQFFTLYNTLDDKKVYLEKEVSNDSSQLLATQEFIGNIMFWWKFGFEFRYVRDFSNSSMSIDVGDKLNK